MQLSNEASQKLAAEEELAKREAARRHLLDFILYSFPEYRINWHHRVIAEKLEAVLTEKNKRIMIFVPPRHGKSEECSVQFPAFAMGRDKDLSVLLASYSADLSQEFGRQTRNIVASGKYQKVFLGTTLSEDSNSKGTWNTNGRGAYNAVGVGGAATGKGADILIIDDPIKNRKDAESLTIRDAVWDWWRSTARTRLSPTGSVIIIQTRWHKDDLAGRILKNDPDGWEVVNLPAIAVQDEQYRKAGEALWPDQFPLESLNRTKKDIGSYEFSCLYQQTPVDSESQEFKPEWIKKISLESVLLMRTKRFLTVDTALSEKDSDDNTGIVLNYVNDQNFWHLRAFKLRVNSADLLKFLFKIFVDERLDQIGIEETVYLKAIKPFLDDEQRRRNIFLPIVPLKHGGNSKVLRIRGLIPRYESGSVYHIDQSCVDLEDEMIAFPNGLHDDVLDADAYQLHLASAPATEVYSEVPFVAPRY